MTLPLAFKCQFLAKNRRLVAFYYCYACRMSITSITLHSLVIYGLISHKRPPTLTVNRFVPDRSIYKVRPASAATLANKNLGLSSLRDSKQQEGGIYVIRYCDQSAKLWSLLSMRDAKYRRVGCVGYHHHYLFHRVVTERRALGEAKLDR